MEITKFVEDDLKTKLSFIYKVLEDKDLVLSDVFKDIYIFKIEDLKLEFNLNKNKAEFYPFIMFFFNDNSYKFLTPDDSNMTVIEFVYVNKLEKKLKYIIIFNEEEKEISLYKIINSNYLKNEIEKRKLESSNFFKDLL